MRHYNKLVRDKIPEIIAAKGETPITSTISREEYPVFLRMKLLEEVAEFQKDDSVEELADICEVILAILSNRSISIEEFEKIRMKKVHERGSFTQRVMLKSVIEKESTK